MFIVYKTTNIINHKFYIGYHETSNLNLNDSYLGSGIWLKHSIDKYGSQNFVRETLFIFDNSKDAFNKEMEVIALYRGIDPLCINLNCGGSGGEIRNYSTSEESRLKRSIANKGRKLSAETKAKIGKANKISQKGKVLSEETKAKIREAFLGTHPTEEMLAKRRGRKNTSETIAKMSAAAKGRKASPETLERMSKAKKGKPCSEETKAKLTGKKQSDEARKKKSEALKAFYQRKAKQRLKSAG